MSDNNFFLAPGGPPAVKGGGGGFSENPAAVENIVFQTRGAPLDAFEAKLAEDLMQVFGTGAEELEDVVRGLNATGSIDAQGAAWTDESFVAQMSVSAAALFATTEGVAVRG
jgi:hypothetical protein